MMGRSHAYRRCGTTNLFAAWDVATAVRLQRLYLSDNEISNLQPLSGMTNLGVLHLDDNEVADLQPLSGLSNLSRVQFERNQITDIGPLVSNTGLGSYDMVDLRYNWLDLREGSQASQDIQALRDRGVAVGCDHQTPHIVTITEGPSGDASPVESGADVQCSGAAECSFGHDVTYKWTAGDALGNPAGSFDDDMLQIPTWTAANNTADSIADYTIEVTATCAQDNTIFLPLLSRSR